MAMSTGLIAFAPDVYLERLQTAACEDLPLLLEFLFEWIRHSDPFNRWLGHKLQPVWPGELHNGSQG